MHADFPSLFQRPRSKEEEAAFRRAVKVMGDLYASAVGTTVLQIKEIPPRPQRLDGALCLFGLKGGVDEAAVRQALGRDLATDIESVDLTTLRVSSSIGIVRFTTHAAALRAKAATTLLELCGGVDTREFVE